MDAIDTLEKEIRLEELALQAVERELTIIRKTGRPDFVRLRQLIDFARNFEDRSHKKKIVDHLFLHLKEHGNAASRQQLEEMTRELENETRLIRIISEAASDYSMNDLGAVEAIRKAFQDYRDSLKTRIHKETAYLMPLLRRILTDAEKRVIANEFEAVDRECEGPDALDRYERILKQAAG